MSSVITGTVNFFGVPVVLVSMAGQSWPAVIDTGFNGDLELPDSLWSHVNPRFIMRIRSRLGGGLTVDEDNYEVDFPFDGEMLMAEATFVNTGEILIGTHLLRRHRLEINFVARTVLVEKSP
jgi:predicted aspartyl protease